MKFQDLFACKKSVTLATNIFGISKEFPKEETYSLTDQVRRSSRSTDGDAENSETQVWLEYAFLCNHISEEIYKVFHSKSEEVGKLINFMILNPAKFGVKSE